MKGHLTLTVESNCCNYRISLKRNISILRGDSGTGKTTLINILLESIGNRRINVNISCTSSTVNGFKVLTKDMEQDYIIDFINKHDNYLILCDEDVKFIYSKEFSGLIKNTSHYYLFVTRRSLGAIPYAVDSIYELVTNIVRVKNEKVALTENINVYKKSLDIKINLRVTQIITEDSNSGYEFYKSFNLNCVNSGGNSKIASKLQKFPTSTSISIIFDGSAFGAHIDYLCRIGLKYKHLTLYSPESFEYLLLISDIFKNLNDDYKDLDTVSDNIESSLYYSWERYFTDELMKLIKNFYNINYDKHSLPKIFLNNSIKLNVINEILKNKIEYIDKNVTWLLENSILIEELKTNNTNKCSDFNTTGEFHNY
jgi:hypothetical protein